MQSIVSKGKNLQEAIQIGLNILDVRQDQVNIEIIQNETKGLFGIGGKKAVVKLNLLKDRIHVNSTDQKNPENPNDTIENLIETLTVDNNAEQSRLQAKKEKTDKVDMKGKVWISNGMIHVKDSPLKYPMVTINKGVTLIKNNEAVKEKSTVVTEKDILAIKLDEDIEETKWKITTDAHKIKAILEVEPGYKISREIQDVAPSDHLELTAEEVKEVSNTLDNSEVLAQLESLRITYGINENEIAKATNCSESGKFEVATGKLAEPGINGSIDLKVDTEIKNVLTEDENGKINFRESTIIPTVEQGEVLGIIYPPVPGKSGITVTNEVLPSKPAYSMKVKIGKGTLLVENKIIATEPGRPSIEVRGQLVKASIMPKLVHQGNVNISSGNIRFYGDIEILGEVEENMIVESGSDLIIYKSVNDSTVTASNSIIGRGNISSSVLTAGKNNMTIVELGQILEVMSSQLENMILVINQLSRAPAFKSSDFARGGLQPLIRILLEKKFSNFLGLSKNYVNIASKNKEFLDEDWITVSTIINKTFLMVNHPVTSVDQLKDLLNQTIELWEISKTPIEPGSYLTVSSALNSSLYSSGDIVIVGQGSVNSRIHAGGQVKINGTTRGGEVFGKQGVHINEVGSNGETKTIIEVPADKSIQIDKAYAGTVLKIGNVKVTLETARNNINARLNEDQQIIFG
ncbi:FapA family protein [Oceanobacillus damuensis]|uniref:FapA family protein n=1 Tax=Oceanobacillus damuensis TaxID=937928 RepID=UPI00082E913A|nr:FapA family protein [Oceanobacillus damuensis]